MTFGSCRWCLRIVLSLAFGIAVIASAMEATFSCDKVFQGYPDLLHGGGRLHAFGWSHDKLSVFS